MRTYHKPLFTTDPIFRHPTEKHSTKPIAFKKRKPKCKKEKKMLFQESFLRHPITSLHNKSIFAFNKNDENNSVNVSEVFSLLSLRFFQEVFQLPLFFFFLISQLAHSLFITCSHALLLRVCVCSPHWLKLLCAAGLIRQNLNQGHYAHFSPHTHSARKQIYTQPHTKYSSVE